MAMYWYPRYFPRTSIVVTTQPAVEPITLAEAKAWLHIDDTADDAVITRLIVAAREKVETDTGRKLITQTIDQSMDRLPCDADPLLIMTGPVQSITSVTVNSAADVASVVSAATYFLDSSRAAARVVLKQGQLWPVDQREEVAVVVRAIVGYGASGANVPESLRLAMQLLVGEWFGCDGEMQTSAHGQRAYDALIEHYRLEWVS